MRMAHPMHVHNLQFRVIERSGPGHALSAGFTDEGLKDVVLVLPGQRVKVLMKFEDHTGLYLYHCHILEHEDLGMMATTASRRKAPETGSPFAEGRTKWGRPPRPRRLTTRRG